MNVLSTRSRELDTELAQLEAQLTRRWPDLPRPIVQPWSEEPVVVLDREQPWLYGPAERDPMRNTDGHPVLPREPRGRLTAMASRGVPFQRVAVAHELDPAGPVRDLLPALRLGPYRCDDSTARLLVGPLPVHPGVARAARSLTAVLGGPASGSGRFFGRLLDPIVFGIVAPQPPSPGEPCLWFPLAAWRW